MAKFRMGIGKDDFRAKEQYLIIGSDNFWYASCLKSREDVEAELDYIKKNITDFCDPETGEHKTELPEKFYIYEAKEIGRLDNKTNFDPHKLFYEKLKANNN